MSQNNRARNHIKSRIGNRIASRIAIVAFLISLAIHIAPASYFLFQATQSKSQTKISQSQQTIDVELLTEIAEAQSVQSTANAVRTSLKRPARKLPSEILTGGFQKRSLENHFTKAPANDTDVAVTSQGESENSFPSDPFANVKESSHGWSRAVQYGNAMGLQFTLESLSFFKALHQRINSQLVYPDEFSKQRITGKVRIEAELDRDGRLIRFTSTVADDKLLQTYCFAILMQILSQPLPEYAWLEKPKSIVAFDFEFHIRAPQDIPRILPMSIEKNRLAFARENEVDPLLNEKITELLTHYIPPIIPIPGGFYVDFVLAYQYVNNLINGAPTEREKREARLTQLHELLRMTLRANGIVPSPTPTPHPDG